MSGPQAAQILRLLKPFCNPSGEKSDITEAMEMGATALEAAPELLAALEIWARYAESNGWTDADHHDGDPATTGWITRTRAAIARAKGRA